MNIVICGAGTIGSHVAEVLAGRGHSLTVIDRRADRLNEIEEHMDVRTLQGNCAYGEILSSAGAASADLLITATDSDEINLLAACVGKGVGTKATIARVRHSAYFDERGVDYSSILGIDHFICPEYLTALAIASTLRNPGALAIENFARGAIEMQELIVGAGAPAVGTALSDLTMPPGTRAASLRRGESALIPEARTVIQANDKLVLVGNRDAFQQARKLFADTDTGRRKVVIMGGSPMAVWLCRALRDRAFSIRMFEIDRTRAKELAEKLDWITVLNADPTDPAVFEEEDIDTADAFVSLRTDDDEHNILAGAWAKSRGVKMAIAAVQRPNYLHLMQQVGIDRPFSPQAVAVHEIENLMDDRQLHKLAELAEGAIDVYQVTISKRSPAAGKALRNIKLSPDWVIAAIQHGEQVKVPLADDVIEVGDTAMVIGKDGQEAKLKRLLVAG